MMLDEFLALGRQYEFDNTIPEAILATGLGRIFLYDRMMSGELKSRKIGWMASHIEK